MRFTHPPFTGLKTIIIEFRLHSYVEELLDGSRVTIDRLGACDGSVRAAEYHLAFPESQTPNTATVSIPGTPRWSTREGRAVLSLVADDPTSSASKDFRVTWAPKSHAMMPVAVGLMFLGVIPVFAAAAVTLAEKKEENPVKKWDLHAWNPTACVYVQEIGEKYHTLADRLCRVTRVALGTLYKQGLIQVTPDGTLSRMERGRARLGDDAEYARQVLALVPGAGAPGSLDERLMDGLPALTSAYARLHDPLLEARVLYRPKRGALAFGIAGLAIFGYGLALLVVFIYEWILLETRWAGIELGVAFGILALYGVFLVRFRVHKKVQFTPSGVTFARKLPGRVQSLRDSLKKADASDGARWVARVKTDLDYLLLDPARGAGAPQELCAWVREKYRERFEQHVPALDELTRFLTALHFPAHIFDTFEGVEREEGEEEETPSAGEIPFER